jgi:hypothetical protein
MIQENVPQGLFEPTWGPDRIATFSVQKKHRKYRLIIAAVSANRHTLEDTGIPANIELFSEAFPRLHNLSMVDYYSGYVQRTLHMYSQEYVAFQATQAMYRPSRVV